MNEECPNCRQLTNTSFSRLVKDSCGHTKCRMCLLYEEQGCKACNNEHRIQNIGNYDCPQSVNKTTSGTTNGNKDVMSSEEIVLPLELVINKDSKQKVNYVQYSSNDCLNIVDSYREEVTFDIRREVYEEPTEDLNNGNICNETYIPKIEPSEVVLNIRAQLDNDANRTIDAPISVNRDKPNPNDSNTSFNVYKEKQNKPVKHLDRSHISVIPGNPERYKCNVCCKIFRNKKGKCYHDACITGIKPYQCKLCDRSFVKRSHFEYHERVHTGYKPFKCNLCEKAFPQQNKLNRHMYSHNKEKHFACTKCKKAYSKQDDLKNHLQLHIGTATYSCKSCGKSFRILTNLKRHMRTHTSERPHMCDQCGKSFKDKSLLLRHKRTHGKDRPFSCAHCNRVFLSKSELRRHLTVHSDEKPFSCEYCQTVFRRKDNLKRHIRHHHSEDSAFEPCRVQSTIVERNTKLNKPKQPVPKQKQKQKPKKTQKVRCNTVPKSPTKMSVVYVNSRDQINSRLDSMGNITPVIRTTGELSNAVPVINGPISIKHSDDKSVVKKTFTYTEPIPVAEAVVLNRRIEEKLYPQTVLNHNYFLHNCSNYNDKSYSIKESYMARTVKNLNTKNDTYENTSEEATATIQNNFTCRSNESQDLTKNLNIGKQASTERTIENSRNIDRDSLLANLYQGITTQSVINHKSLPVVTLRNDNHLNGLKQNVYTMTTHEPEQINCVPTIKKCIIQQTESENLKEANVANSLNTSDSLTAKHIDLNQRKHWRRRITEILKPNN